MQSQTLEHQIARNDYRRGRKVANDNYLSVRIGNMNNRLSPLAIPEDEGESLILPDKKVPIADKQAIGTCIVCSPLVVEQSFIRGLNCR